MASEFSPVLQHAAGQKVPPAMLAKVSKYRKGKSASGSLPPAPASWYYGPEVLRLLLATFLAGLHAALKGPKGGGKNTAIETVAHLLNTPLSEISGHNHLDADAMVGHEVFKSSVRDAADLIELHDQLTAKGIPDNIVNSILQAQTRQDEVAFLHGTIAIAARDGHICCIDEANTIRPEALIVTHPLRDERRRLFIPGYGTIKAHPRFRMALTMNPGYAGTTELNEATADGFVPIYVPPMSEKEFSAMIHERYRNVGLIRERADLLAKLFHDLLSKYQNGEVDGRVVSVRAVFQSLDLILEGVMPLEAVTTTFVTRTDDSFMQNVVRDVVRTLIPENAGITWMFNEAPVEAEKAKKRGAKIAAVEAEKARTEKAG